MTANENDMFYCSFVSIHYIICECGETFPSEDDLKTHLEIEHPHKKERKEFKCGACGTVYSSEEDCIAHYETEHIKQELDHDYAELPQDDEDKDSTYVEEEEEEEYEEKYETKDEQEDEYIETYESMQHLPQDIRMVKAAKERRTKRSSPVSEKPRQKKKYSKDVVCEVCGKSYLSNAALGYHQRVHTGERPYKCSMCPKTFTMPLFLQIHVRTHTGERPYQCPMCPKAFSNKAALLRHDRVHTGIKPYTCTKCGKSFTQSNSLKLHFNTVHLKMPAPYKSKSRRLKERERLMMKELTLVATDDPESMVTEVTTATENILPDLEIASLADGQILVKTESVDMYHELPDNEVLYEEDIDSRGITYEIVYEE